MRMVKKPKKFQEHLKINQIHKKYWIGINLLIPLKIAKKNHELLADLKYF